MRTEMMNALRVQLKREPAKFNITNRLPATSVTSGKQYFFKLNVGDDDVAGPFIWIKAFEPYSQVCQNPDESRFQVQKILVNKTASDVLSSF